MPSDHNRQKPLARAEGLLFSPLNDELVIYDTECDKAHSLNRVTSLIWRHCDGATSIGQLTALLVRELQTPLDEQVVWSALRQLARSRLLQHPVASPAGKISRRALARRLGLAAAVALPIVTSLAVPPAAAAGSQGAPGSPCTISAQCLSGLCLGNGTCA